VQQPDRGNERGGGEGHEDSGLYELGRPEPAGQLVAEAVAFVPSTQSPMRPVGCGTELMPTLHPCGGPQFPWAVGGVMKCGRSRNSMTSRMASHRMNAATMAAMLRRSSSPASTANPNAHRR
jgi:hypothetical protein